MKDTGKLVYKVWDTEAREYAVTYENPKGEWDSALAARKAAADALAHGPEDLERYEIRGFALVEVTRANARDLEEAEREARERLAELRRQRDELEREACMAAGAQNLDDAITSLKHAAALRPEQKEETRAVLRRMYDAEQSIEQLESLLTTT